MSSWTLEHFGREKPHFNVARLKAGGENFEVIVHPEQAMAFKQSNGSAGDITAVLVYDRVFADAKKGLAASEHVMKSAFGTNDAAEVARQILLKGEIQMTSAYRNKLVEDKRRFIVDMIHRLAVDPRTGFPHPPVRVDAALAEARVKIDEHKSAEEQVQGIVRQLMPVLSIKLEVRQVEFHIPARYASHAHSVLKRFGVLQKDMWQGDGSLVAVVEVPAGLQEGLFSEINRLTHGDAESKVVGAK